MRTIIFLVVIILLTGAVYMWKKEKTDLPAPEIENGGQINFEKTGNIVSGDTEGNWDLVYEEPGKPALRVALLLTPQSLCEKGTSGLMSCDSPFWDIGSRVKVVGSQKNDFVEISTLSVLN